MQILQKVHEIVTPIIAGKHFVGHAREVVLSVCKCFSTEFKDILRNDGKKRDVAKSNWLGVVSRIRKVLQTFSPEVVDSPAARRKYFISGTLCIMN